MPDRVTTLLVGLEERFDRHGHDTRIVTLQKDAVGMSVLQCAACDEVAFVSVLNVHGGYKLNAGRLDSPCV